MLTKKQKKKLALTLHGKKNGNFKGLIYSSKHLEEVNKFYEDNLAVIEIDKDGSFTSNSSGFADFCIKNVYKKPIKKFKKKNAISKNISSHVTAINKINKEIKSKINYSANSDTSKYAKLKRALPINNVKKSLDTLAKNDIEVKIIYYDDNGEQVEFIYNRKDKNSKKLANKSINKIRLATYKKIDSNSNGINSQQFYENLITLQDLSEIENIAFDKIDSSLTESDFYRIKENAQRLIDVISNADDFTRSLLEKAYDLEALKSVCNKVFQKRKEGEEINKNIQNELGVIYDLEKDKDNSCVKIAQKHYFVPKLKEFNNQVVLEKTKEIINQILNAKFKNNREQFMLLVSNYNICKKLSGNDPILMNEIGIKILKKLKKIKIKNFCLEARNLEKDYKKQQRLISMIEQDLELNSSVKKYDNEDNADGGEEVDKQSPLQAETSSSNVASNGEAKDVDLKTSVLIDLEENNKSFVIKRIEVNKEKSINKQGVEILNNKK